MSSKIKYIKILSAFYCIICIGGIAFSQEKNPNYDPSTAVKYGGDEFGKKNYVLAILKAPIDSLPQVNFSKDLKKGFTENLNKLATEGKLILNAPLAENPNKYGGVFILDVPTIEEASLIFQENPAVKAGVFVVDYFPWYGPAALNSYLNDQNKIWVIKE